MADGDYHVEQKGGAWVLELEGRSKNTLTQIERLATPDQAWQIATYYAQAGAVDAFLHEGRKTPKEVHFRPSIRRRGR